MNINTMMLYCYTALFLLKIGECIKGRWNLCFKDIKSENGVILNFEVPSLQCNYTNKYRVIIIDYMYLLNG